MGEWQVGSITPAPTPEEVAAITAALAVIEAETAAAADPPESLSMWVEVSRRAAQRASYQRGPWRLSGRIGRRSRV